MIFIFFILSCFYIQDIQDIEINNNLTAYNNLLNDLKQIITVDFDFSMRAKLYNNKVVDKSDLINKRISVYKKLYEQNKPSKILPSIEPKIPKIIHQIWLGKNPFPQKFKRITQKWIQMHPGWQYKLWTDSNVNEISLINKKFFYESTNMGERSDILRLEILDQIGGLYVDVDYECLRSFDILNHCYDFYVGIESVDASPYFIGNAFVASCPGHPILKACIEKIKDYRRVETITKRTGPGFLTDIFCDNALQCQGNIIAFPASYLYPYGYKDGRKKLPVNAYFGKESFGVHYWAATWVK